MSIPEKYRHRSLYHFTHLNNLASIIRYGLLSAREVEQRGLKHTTIAYQTIQERRASMRVPCGPRGVIHDYVPLYFCKRSPMLYAVVNNKIADQALLIYLEFPIAIMERLPCVFTNASANTGEPPGFFHDPTNLDHVDWDAVETWRWGSKHDIAGRMPVRQAKMAEVLVHRSIGIDEVTRIVVFNQRVKDAVVTTFEKEKRTPPPIVVGGAEFYYLDGGRSPVAGPCEIRRKLDKVTAEVIQGIGKAATPKFRGLYPLRDALRADLKCLPETSAIIGLRTGSEQHSEDLGTHTRTVVKILRELPEYQEMRRVDQLLVELAAFFHDVGKGARSRSSRASDPQSTDPNYALRSLQMLARILCEEVGIYKERSARVLCKLVCYHNLIDDILWNGRRVQELQENFTDKRELNMLVAFSKAHCLATDPLLDAWYESQLETLMRELHEG